MSLYKKGKKLVSRKTEGGLTRTKSHNSKSAKWYEKERHEFPGGSTATGNMKAVHSNIYYKVTVITLSWIELLPMTHILHAFSCITTSCNYQFNSTRYYPCFTLQRNLRLLRD